MVTVWELGSSPTSAAMVPSSLVADEPDGTGADAAAMSDGSAATAGFTSMSRGPGAQEERGALVAVEVVAGAHQVVHRAHQALGHLVQVLLVAGDVLVDHAQLPRQFPLLGWKLVWSWLHTNE